MSRTAVVVAVAVGVLAVVAVGRGWIPGETPATMGAGVATSVPVTPGTASSDPVVALFEERRSGVEVQGTGVVTRILADDDEGSRHQKFLLRTPGGISILIAHNIDLAPRLEGLATGDRVDFRGDYEWSDKGGTVHWTHRDPAGEHQDGWLRWNGRTYS